VPETPDFLQLLRLALPVVFVALVSLALLLAVGAIIERTFGRAVKTLKPLLKAEFFTGLGALNFAAVLLVFFVFVFTTLHKSVADAMSVIKPVPPEHEPAITAVHVCWFFIGSVIAVGLLERKR
jgi:hypothetical protein